MNTSLTIAGIEVALSVPKSSVEAIVASRYAPFLGRIATPACSVTIHPADGVDRPGQHLDVIERLGTKVEVAHPGFFGTIDIEGEGALRCAPSPYALDHALRTLFAVVAPRHNALVLHAAAVVSGRGAHVFTGPAGAGKSTVAGLAHPRPVLTDGYVVVRRQADNTWLAASTPFWDAHELPGAPRELPLARLWSLRPSRFLHCVPTDPGASLRSVVENMYVPIVDPEFRKAALDLAFELASVVPSSELGLVPTPTLWPEIEASVA